MKKTLIAVTALLCAAVVLTVTILSTGGLLPVGDVAMDTVPEATTLADETTESSGDISFPAYNEPLPDQYELWDGNTNFEEQEIVFAGGDGSSVDPFQIETPAQFALMLDAINSSDRDPESKKDYAELNYVITKDLVFNENFDLGTDGRPLSTAGLHALKCLGDTVTFSGTLDGGGHRLYNLYIPTGGTGLFGQLKGSVKNLHLVRGYIYAANTNMTAPGGGTFARELTGSLLACSSGVSYVFIGGSCGGIVGVMKNESIDEPAKLANCRFTGSLHALRSAGAKRGDNYIGGILAHYDQSNDLTATVCNITNCVNYGDITTYGKFVGGIVGCISSKKGIVAKGFTIAGCVNYGDISCLFDPAAEGTDVENTMVGGILGGLVGFNGEDGARSISYCTNFGNITAFEARIGGIMGGMLITTDTAYPHKSLTFTCCYTLGYVGLPDDLIHGGCNNVGGLVGYSNAPVVVNSCVISGTVNGNMNVGGVVGNMITDHPNNNASDCCGVSMVTTEITADVKANVAAGGIVGNFTCGDSALMSEITAIGCYFENTVRANSSAGGLVGALKKGKGPSANLLTLNMSYTIQNTRVMVDSGDLAAVLVASLTNADVALEDKPNESDPKTNNYYYVLQDVYTSVDGELQKKENPDIVRGDKSIQLANTFDPVALTNGTYLAYLAQGDTNAGGKAKWASSTLDSKPVHEVIEQIETCPVGREYDATETVFYNSDWLGIAPYCQWYRYEETKDETGDGTEAVTGEWVKIDASPQNVGRYRVEVTLLSQSRSGATIVEFEITQKTLDFLAFSWVGGTTHTYTGYEAVLKLDGIPADLEVQYEDNVAKDVGTYHARLDPTSIKDLYGNYILVNVDQVPVCTWTITPLHMDMNNIIWSDVAEGADHPVLVYNEQEQRIRLMDKTNPDLDLDKVFEITYVLNEETHQTPAATNVGVYYANASISIDSNNVVVENRQTDYDTRWEIIKRVIRPWETLKLSVGKVTADPGVKTVTVTYDAHARALTCNVEDYPASAVDIAMNPLSNAEEFRPADTYPYELVFTLIDAENNVFEIETAPGVYQETRDTVLRDTCYMVIVPATPVIDGVESRGPLQAEEGSSGTTGPIYNGHEYHLGVKYDQSGNNIVYDVLKLDENENPVIPSSSKKIYVEVLMGEGNEVIPAELWETYDESIVYYRACVMTSTIELKIGTATPLLNDELAYLSNPDNFIFRYYRQVQVEKLDEDGNVMKDEKGNIIYEWVDDEDALVTIPGDVDMRPCAPKDAGHYRVEIYFRSPDPNFTDAFVEKTLIISPRTYEVPSNIFMRDTETMYDGDEKELRLLFEEELPSAVIKPVYSYNTNVPPIEPGKYRITVRFTILPEMRNNYLEPKSDSAVLTIKTKTLGADNISLFFGDEGTSYRLLIEERDDANDFITDWSVGYGTVMAKLWQIELKDELSPVYSLPENVTLSLPLSKSMASKKTIVIVRVDIDKNGSFTITKMPTSLDYRSSGELASYATTTISETGFYGIVTSTEGTTDTIWRWVAVAVSLTLAIPATVLVVIGVKRKKRKSRQ